MQGKAKFAIHTLTLAVALSLSATGQAQTLPERHQKIRAALDANDTQTAILELHATKASDPQLFSTNGYDYLLARQSELIGNRAEAQANYTAVVDSNSLLSGYALWHLSQLARAGGDLVLEREQLRRFLASAPASALQEAAMLRLGKSFAESADDSGTISSLRQLVNSANVPVAREAMTLTAQALQRSRKAADAKSWFTRLLMQMPDASRPDDFALAAVRGLDEMDPSFAQLTEADHLLRASVYHFNRDFEGARKHYSSVVDKNPRNPTVPNALYQLGRGYYLQLNYDEALKYFRRVLDEFPESSSARDALGFTAGAYNRMKRTDDAVAAYQLLLARYPEAPNPERTFINIIDALHEAGRHQEALNWVQQTRKEFAGQLGATLALFAQLRINLAQGRWAAVVADAELLKKSADLGGTRVPSGTSLTELSFLRAFALEQMGRTNEAIDLYLSIPDGRNEYYGQRATIHLQALGLNPTTQNLVKAREQNQLSAARQNLSQPDKARVFASTALRLATTPETRKESLQILATSYQTQPAYKFPNLRGVPLGRQIPLTDSSADKATTRTLADELFFLGLYDEAVPALNANRQSQTQANAPTAASPQTSADLEYTLALLSLRGGLANRAVRFGEALWKPIAPDFVLELAPREFAELLYPAPYRASLLRHASPRGVDPRLVLAIARQESRFMFAAKSVAAARGMMQFIPETANDMAGQLGKTKFQQDELYDPDTAVLFGSQYLSVLFKQFPNQPEAVAASYNGGPDNVARWVARSRSGNPEQYVPEIGFTQTKDYVFRVMTNFRAYQTLYPELQK